MNKDEIDFLLRTETCRTISSLCLFAALVSWVFNEFGITGELFNWVFSSTTPVIFALLGIGLRVIAIDRFLRMTRQQDFENKHPRS